MASTIFNKRFDKIVYFVAGIGGMATVVGVSFALYALWPSNAALGFEPVQPIPYSHKIHAGDLKIECLYCHTEAEQGAVARVPPLSVCMNCHSQVKKKDEQGNYTRPTQAFFQFVDIETNQIKKPVHWIKVHDLSDFAYFDHSRHTTGAGLECQECHGAVEEKERVRREFSLKMSWCLDCHRKAPQEPRADGRTTQGSVFCSTCHR